MNFKGRHVFIADVSHSKPERPNYVFGVLRSWICCRYSAVEFSFANGVHSHSLQACETENIICFVHVRC